MTTLITGEIIIPLAGLQFYRLRDCAASIMQGTRLRLVREPDNPYDGNAILVELHADDLEAEEVPLPDGMTAGAVWKLGHVPARTTSENWARLLSRGLDDGLGAECFFAEGERSGAWSVHVRVSGPAVERAQREIADREAAREAHARFHDEMF